MPKISGITHVEAIRRRAGFWIENQGKHVSMANGTYKVVIPRSNPINAFTMAAIVRGSGLTIDEFKALL